MLVESNMLELGSKAPNFQLPNVVSEKFVSLDELKSDIATVIMFICNHCPYVIHIQQALVEFANDYKSKGISIIAISANDAATYPDDSPEKMRDVAKQFNYPFPYLYDESQTVARAYKAACTPDFYIFDKNLKLVYHGQFDDSRPGNDIAVTGKSMRAALDQILAGKSVATAQTPSMGCSIKWKKERDSTT